MQRSKDEMYAPLRWNLGLFPMKDGGAPVSETLWMCDQMRAGQLYTRKIFDTEAEADAFRRKMLQVEPDAIFSVAAVEARQVWN